MVAVCCVCGIEKGTWRGFNLSFHSFPKNEDLRLKWYKAIGKKVYRNACICSKHFKTEDYRNHEDPNLIRKLLKPSAVPDNDLCRKLEFVKNPSFNINISISGDNNNDSVEFVNHVNSKNINNIKNKTNDYRIQADEPNTSTKVNPVTKRILDDKVISYSTANQQTKKRKTENCYILQSVEKQRNNLNVVSGIVRKEDFKHVNTWLRFQKYITEMRKQYKFLLHKNRRLYLKLNNFKDMLDTLRTK